MLPSPPFLLVVPFIPALALWRKIRVKRLCCGCVVFLYLPLPELSVSLRQETRKACVVLRLRSAIHSDDRRSCDGA